LHAVPRPDGPARAPRKGPALGEILVESKTLTEEQLREAMTRQQRSKKRLGEILMELGFASPDEVLDVSLRRGQPESFCASCCGFLLDRPSSPRRLMNCLPPRAQGDG
jgi:hypothetical protein